MKYDLIAAITKSMPIVRPCRSTQRLSMGGSRQVIRLKATFKNSDRRQIRRNLCVFIYFRDPKLV
jgi:hypothetical protein